jgi:membrane protein YdbS with pleckstrin-like domain
MNCPQCGANAVLEAIYCQKCGARLPAPSATAKPASQAASAAEDADLSADPPAAERLSPGQGRIVGGARGPIPDVPEVVLWEGGYSPKALAGPALISAIVTIGLLLAGFAIRGWFWWIALGGIAVIWLALLIRFGQKSAGVHYKLTNQRFFHQRGLLRRVTHRIEVIDIDDIAWEQGVLDRIVGVGRITIVSSDRAVPALWIEGIEDVERVAGLMDSARRAERLRRGVSVEQM